MPKLLQKTYFMKLKTKINCYTIAGLLALFILVTILSMAGAFAAIDDFAFRVGQLISNPTILHIMQFIADFVGMWYVVLLFTLFLIAVPFTRHKYGFPLAVALGASRYLNIILKEAFSRPRPRYFVYAGSYSFPSGHSQGAATLYIGLAILLFDTIRRHKGFIALAVVYALLTLITGFQRVMIRVHYLGDVIAGFSIGIAIAIAAFMLLELVGSLTARFKRYKLIRYFHEIVFCKYKYPDPAAVLPNSPIINN